MAIRLNDTAVSKLARIDTAGMKHAEKITAFAKTLGYTTGAALMSAARGGETSLGGKPPIRGAGSDDIRAAVSEVLPYLLWLSGPDGPGHHPALPAAINRLCLAAGMGSDKTEEKAAEVPGPDATANIYSDDLNVHLIIDVREWLAQIPGDKLSALVSYGNRNEGYFGPSNETDEVFYFYEDDERVAPLVKRISDQCGFSVMINKEEAVAWLVEHRPDLAVPLFTLRSEGHISFDDDAVAHWPDMARSHDIILSITHDDTDLPEKGEMINASLTYSCLVRGDAPMPRAFALAYAIDTLREDRPGIREIKEAPPRRPGYAEPRIIFQLPSLELIGIRGDRNTNEGPSL